MGHGKGAAEVSVVLARYTTTAAGIPRWVVRLDQGLAPDVTIAVRIDASHATPLDYYVLPALDLRPSRLRLAEDNSVLLDTYRVETLDGFVASVTPVRIEAAA